MLKIEDVIKNYGGKFPKVIMTIKCYWDLKPERDGGGLYKREYEEVTKASGGVPLSRVYVGYGLLEHAFLCNQFSRHVQIVQEYKTSWCVNKIRVCKIEFDCCIAYAFLTKNTPTQWSLCNIYIDVPGVALNITAQVQSSTQRAYLVQSFSPWEKRYQFFILPELRYPTNMRKFLEWVKDSGKGFADIPISSLELWCKEGRDKKNLTTINEIQNWLVEAKTKRFLEDKYRLPDKICIDYSKLLQPIDIIQDDVDLHITEYNQRKRWEIKF